MPLAYLSATSQTETRFRVRVAAAGIANEEFSLGNAPWILPEGDGLLVGGDTTSDTIDITVIYKIE